MPLSFTANKPIDTITNFLQREFTEQKAFFDKIKAGPLPRWRFQTLKDYKINLQPIDFNPVHPERIKEFYCGNFALGGRMVNCGRISPFAIEPPSLSFSEELQSFSWLRDLAAANSKISSSYATSMLEAWINSCRYRSSDIAWRPDIVAQRIIAWLCNCKMLLKHAKPNLAKKYYKSLSFQYRYLYTTASTMPENEQKVKSFLGLAFCSLCLSTPAKQKKYIEKKLDQLLDSQIYPDGGHISRSPKVMIDLLLPMLALRSCYHFKGLAISKSLSNAIDRMIPALRLFIHSNGDLANFNGVGYIEKTKIQNIFALDANKATAINLAKYSGFQRLEAENTVIIADIGAGRVPAANSHATAGCLSFEMSSSEHNFIVNCATDYFNNPEYADYDCPTSAHSTATIEDLSQNNFCASNNRSLYDMANMQVFVEQIKSQEQFGFIASHDGYKKSHNMIHQRKITLSYDGTIIQGGDSFEKASDSFPSVNASTKAIIRFHIHPDIDLSYSSIGNIYLTAPSGESWCFSCSHINPKIEDSIFFAGSPKPRATKQIVLRFHPSIRKRIAWMFQKHG